MILFCKNISSRLKYVAEFLLQEIMGQEVVFCTNPAELENNTEIIINYSDDKNLPGFHISPHSLLSEKGVHAMEIQVEWEDELPRFFKTNGSNLNFDVFAAAFYLVSRYEEYLPFVADKYGRYKASNSIVFQNNFSDIPVINAWVALLKGKLENIYPEIKLNKPVFSAVLTMDIDNPWAHLNKSAFILIGGMLKSVLRADFQSVGQRFKVLLGKEKDPYDNYDFIEKHHKKGLKIFILAGDKGRQDNRVKIKNKSWQKLINRLNVNYEIGLHPSFRSGKSIKALKKEKLDLERIIHKKVINSRQHFLLLNLPESYQKLITLGIHNDYSMLYAESTGFRAGTSSSFFFYDLKNEEKTELRIHPGCLMDRTLKDYQGNTPEEAIATIKKFVKIIKKYGGVFIPVWHNESLSDKGEWENWRGVYQTMLKEL